MSNTHQKQSGQTLFKPNINLLACFEIPGAWQKEPKKQDVNVVSEDIGTECKFGPAITEYKFDSPISQ
jgi:hypothetical protein